MRTVAGGLVAVAVGVGCAGCGAHTNAAERVLQQASRQIANLRSGRIAVSGEVDPVGPGQVVRVRAHGSFAAAGPEEAPVAELVDERTRRIVRADAPLSSIRLQDWVASPEVKPRRARDDAATLHVHGRLVPSAAFDDVGALGLAPASPAGAVGSGSVDVWIGRRDHVLRRLVVRAELGLHLPAGVAFALGRPVGAKVWLELDLTDPVTWTRTSR